MRRRGGAEARGVAADQVTGYALVLRLQVAHLQVQSRKQSEVDRLGVIQHEANNCVSEAAPWHAVVARRTLLWRLQVSVQDLGCRAWNGLAHDTATRHARATVRRCDARAHDKSY